MGNQIPAGYRVESDGGSLAAMVDEQQAWAGEKGWLNDGRTFGDEIALIHSELSEALEAYREYGFRELIVNDKPEGIASELADTLIRLLDTCGRHDIDLFAAFRLKMDYNWNRAFRHGGKAL